MRGSRIVAVAVAIAGAALASAVPRVVVAAAGGSAAASTSGAHTSPVEADAFVRRDRPWTRYGSSTRLRAFTARRIRSYVRFQVRGLEAPVVRATLHLYARTSSARGLVARRARTNRWSERNITYGTAPGIAPTVVARSGGYRAGEWTSLDVSALVTGNGTYSLVLTSRDRGVIVASRETGRAPRVVVRTEIAPAVPPSSPSPSPSSPSPSPSSPPPAPAPDTSISSGPPPVTRTASPTIAFSSDTPGATFECSIDDAAFEACTSPATYHVANGGNRVRVRAVTSDSIDPTPAEWSWWSDALLANGNFETAVTGWSAQGYSIAGWKGFRATLSPVTGGISGPGAGLATFAGGGSDFSMYSSPKPVNSTIAGTNYDSTGWVRSATAGKQVCLRFREWASSGIVGTSTPSCVTTTAGWQAFPPHEYTTTGNGNELEIFAYQLGAASGDSFELDGLTIDDGEPDPVVVSAQGDPKLLGLADLAACWANGDEATARLLDTLPGTIGIAGDTEYDSGTADEFAGCYDPAWGRHKARTKPSVGDHEYRTPGATGYWDYFGAAAGPRSKGWYSYDLGAWHIIVLNSNCSQVGGCGPGSEQYAWLEADLAANATTCTGAYFHHSRWSVGSEHGSSTHVQPFWDLLYGYSAEFVYGGNDHNYQRYAPQTPEGVADPGRGIRQFVVGTGGAVHYTLGPSIPNLEVANDDAFGVLELTLRSASYDWRFVPQAGRTFTDSGSTECSPLP